MEELISSGLAGIDIFPGEVEAKKRGGAERKNPRWNPEQSIGSSPAAEEDLISSGLAGMDLFLPTGEESEPAKAAKKRGVKAKFLRRVKPPPPPLTPPPPYKPEPPRVFRAEVHAISDYRGRWDALSPASTAPSRIRVIITHTFFLPCSAAFPVYFLLSVVAASK
jgi:hypothetical protein